MTKTLLIKAVASAGLALAGLLAAGGAQAGTNVQWSIGINAPIAPGVALGTVVSSGPAWYPAPVYAPAPVVYAPAPVVYAPPVYVAPRPVYVRPAPVVVHRPGYVRGGVVPHWPHGGGHGHHDRGYGPVAWDGRGR